MTITIIAVGKKHDVALSAMIEAYQKRLQSSYEVRWQIISSQSRSSPTEQQKVESGLILRCLNNEDFVVLLDETGKLLDNNQLAELIGTNQRKVNVCFIIGGAYGVDEVLKARANLLWSLSPLVFPHQLVRAILMEQLYRSYTIITGHPYHHQ